MSGAARLLHLISTGGPGGAETVFAQVATGLARRGHPTVTVIKRDAWLAEQLRAGGLEPRFLAGRGSLDRRYFGGIVDLIRTERPDVVFAHLLGPAIYASAAGLWTGTPVVGVLHGQTDLGPNERFRAAKAALIRRGCRRLVFVSDQLRQDIAQRLSIQHDRCLVIPDGVDVGRYEHATPAPLRSSLGLPADGVLVGAIGNLRRPKGYDVLLRAARLAIDKEPRLRFVIAGDTSGPVYEDLLALRDDLQLQELVHFLGLRADVPAVLKALDLYVSSSTTEGFSIACCEAMAAGVPIVATRSGGPEQILDQGRCGRLVAAGDPQALADGLLATLADPETARRLARMARSRVELEYGIDAMIDSYARLAEAVRSNS